MRARALGICMAMLVVTAGCTRGYRFTRPQPETLVLGKTTYEEIVRQVGEPVRAGTAVKNDQSLKVVSYWFSCGGFACKAEEWTGEVGVATWRAMDFYFLDGVLVGYYYTSTVPGDKTDFDDIKAYQLKKGQTTRSQVIELLGKPSGMYIYPMISSKTDTALVYFYRAVGYRAVGPGKRATKLLVVSFDTHDLVTGAELRPAGENVRGTP